MHEINKICSLKSSRSPLEDDAEKNFKNFGKFSFEHFIRSPARKRSILFCRPFWTIKTGNYFDISGYAGRPDTNLACIWSVYLS